ncbi:MAG: monovalent cation/H+ antiporter subunit D family protein, partial [Chloroflexi bacterium]|nr:monovalent cation/H+ antiporter subunit D family protein [Chloroflexota bacterium]
METYFSIIPLLAVIVSLLAAVLILCSARWPNVRELWTIAGALAKFGLVASMLPCLLAGRYPEIVLFDISPKISLALHVDAAGIIFAL